VTSPSDAAAIYVRRSHKDGDGREHPSRSLAQQEKEARTYAERLGLEVVQVFREREGTGASRRSGKARPEWRRALEDLALGETFQTLVVWELSRADRRGWASLEGHVEVLAEKGRRLLGVDGTDLTDPTQRLANVIRAEMARAESEQIGERVARAKRDDRELGRWLGGRPPFGLTTDADRRLCPDPATAPAARAIVDAVLAGSSLWSIAKTLNGASLAPVPGVPVGLSSVRGGRWTVGTLSAWLRSPSLAGLATERARQSFRDGGRWAAVGSVLRDDEGRPLTVGTGLVSEDEHDRLVRELTSRTVETGRLTRVARTPTRTVAGRGREAAHLLGAGLGACICGASLQVYGVTRDRPLGFLRCSAYGLSATCPAGKPGQGPRATIERHVLARVWAALVFAKASNMPLYHSVLSAYTASLFEAETEELRAARADVDAARAAQERVDDAFADGVLDREGYARQRERLAARVAAAERRVGELAPGAVPAFDPEEPWSVLRSWAEDPRASTIDRRRLVALVVDRVTLLPAPYRGARFDPETRVQIDYRDPGEPGPSSVFREAPGLFAHRPGAGGRQQGSAT
jgi:DNA invertase Pin-like site-specific DNA recombinase